MKIFLLSLILLLGFFLRAQETLSGNFLFLKDQGRDLLAVKSIVMDKKLTLIGPYTGLQAVFQGPFYYYLLAVPFALSGGDPRTVMWLMLGSSMVAVLLAYVVGKKFFSETTGLSAAFLFAVSPSAAAAATFIWSPFLVLPISIAALYFFMDWIRTGVKKSLLLFACLLGLLFHFEIAFAAPLTLSMLFICWYIAHKKRYAFPIIPFTIIFLLMLSPLIFFDVRHNFLTTKSLVSLFWGGNQGLGNGELYSKIMYDHLIRFFLNLKATFIAHEQIAEVFSFLAIVCGLGYSVYGKSIITKALLSIPLVMFILYLLYPFQIWDWYLIGLFPVYLILGAELLCWLWGRPSLRLVVVVLVFILLQGSLLKLGNLYRKPDYGGTAKLKGKIDAIDTVYKDSKGKPFNLLVFTPVVLTDAYDYLLWWYGQKKYGYLPGKEKRNTLYLLIEPDASKPWSYNGWLETEIKVGKVLETRELPSGFIMQKRKV